MNVVCGRCQTEYDFDDVLVSEQGTSVKCTNCGFQFRVHAKKKHSTPSPEHWVVRAADGKTQTFPSLRGLQHAIRDSLVRIDDELSRDGQPFRSLRALEDLKPFFDAAAGTTTDKPNWRRGTLLGVGDESFAASAPRPHSAQPFARSDSAPPEAPDSEQQGVPTVRHRASYQGGEQAPAQPPGAEASAPSTTATNWLAAPIPVGADHPHPDQGHEEHAAAYQDQWSAQAHAADPENSIAPGTGYAEAGDHYTPQSYGEPAAGAAAPSEEQSLRHQGIPRRHRRGSLGASEVPASDPLASRLATHPPPPLTIPPPPKRTSGMRWVVALVLFGGLGLAAGTVGKDYIQQFVTPRASTGVRESNIEASIDQAEKHLLSGDIEAAKEVINKSGATDSVEIVRASLRVATAEADVAWLDHRIRQTTLDRARAIAKQRPKDTPPAGSGDDRIRILTQELDSSALRMRPRLQRLERALNRFQVYEDEARSASSVEANALRVLGQLKTARAKISSDADMRSGTNDGEVTYVLAMLDAAEKNPSWAAISDRLKRAAEAESGLDRSAVARIWALSQAERVQEAADELAKLTKSDSTSKKQPAADVSPFRQLGPALTVLLDFAAPAKAPAPATDETTKGEPTRVRQAVKRSPQELVVAAERYKLKGDLARARGLYSAALSQQPGNVQAITGLGDIARKSGNLDLAMRQYDAALRQAPNHQPAVIGSADIKWIRGQRQAATALYRRIPAGSPFRSRAAKRIEEFTAWSGDGSKSNYAPTAPGNPSAAPGPLPRERSASRGDNAPRDTNADSNSRLPASGTAPHIDTTDLPE